MLRNKKAAPKPGVVGSDFPQLSLPAFSEPSPSVMSSSFPLPSSPACSPLSQAPASQTPSASVSSEMLRESEGEASARNAPRR